MRWRRKGRERLRHYLGEQRGRGRPGGLLRQGGGDRRAVDEALSNLDGGDVSVSDAFTQIAEELRGIEAPPAIAADWDAMAGGLDRIGEAVSNLDITDPDSLAALDGVDVDLSKASANVETYLKDECGIDTGSGATS
jgi:hypothetical protein